MLESLNRDYKREESEVVVEEEEQCARGVLRRDQFFLRFLEKECKWAVFYNPLHLIYLFLYFFN